MDVLSVNEAIERLRTLDGEQVALFGQLSLEFEGTELIHLPKSERSDGQDGLYQSRVWTEFDMLAAERNEGQLDRLEGRQVILQGTLHAPNPEFGGCGHFALWPAKIRVASIEKR